MRNLPIRPSVAGALVDRRNSGVKLEAGAILASRASPVRDARFIRREMKKVFNIWFVEPIFLKISPSDGRNVPVGPSQTLPVKDFLPGEEPGLCGAWLPRV
jgi:hypothetical protein